MTEVILVIVSCRVDEAQAIAKPLVEEKLAVCVSIVPAVKSIYIWQDKLCQEEESLLLIKTSRANWPNLEKRIKALHSYDVPEILAIPVEAGHKPYLDWLDKAVGKRLEGSIKIE